MYPNLPISLLAAFIAMLGKQWLNRYLRNSGGSVIERCGDRQRKFDELEKWPFHSFVTLIILLPFPCAESSHTLYLRQYLDTHALETFADKLNTSEIGTGKQ